MAGRPATLKIDILADASKANKEMDGFSGKVGKFGKVLGAASAAGALAVGALAVSAIKSASEVQQAFGATESIFGKQAKAVIASAKGAATQVGLAQSEYANLANVLGSQLKNMGTASDQLAPKTGKLIGLGADLAATFGGTTADAVSAVSSLLKGERDPIERYGVSIKQADINAQLAAKGLGKLTGEAAKQAEAQVVLELLTKQTAAAQGSFARESGTLAGQTQRLGAMWENMKASLGERLLPAVTAVATYFTTNVVPAVQLLAAELRERLAPVVSAVSDFFTTKLVPAGQAFFAWFMEKIVPGIKAYIVPQFEGLRSIFDQVRSAVERNGPQLEKLFAFLKGLAEFIAKYVAPVIGGVLKLAFQGLGFVLGTVIDYIGLVVDGVSKLVDWIQRLADKISNSGIISALGKVGDVAGKVGGGLGKVGGLFSSGVSAEALQAARYGPAGLTGSGGESGYGIIPSVVNSFTPTVLVQIGERELTEMIDVRVISSTRATARRAVGVRP